MAQNPNGHLQPDTELETLDLGEQSTILLVEQLGADLLIMDKLVGRQIARSRGQRVIGTLEILEEAGRLGWIDLPGVHFIFYREKLES